nr:cohesin subunit SA-3 [Zootoca vivipara]
MAGSGPAATTSGLLALGLRLDRVPPLPLAGLPPDRRLPHSAYGRIRPPPPPLTCRLAATHLRSLHAFKAKAPPSPPLQRSPDSGPRPAPEAPRAGERGAPPSGEGERGRPSPFPSPPGRRRLVVAGRAAPGERAQALGTCGACAVPLGAACRAGELGGAGAEPPRFPRSCAEGADAKQHRQPRRRRRKPRQPRLRSGPAMASSARALRPRRSAPAQATGSDDSVASDSGGSAFEETLRGKAGKRQATRRRAAPKDPLPARAEQSGLFQAVKAGRSAAQSVVDDWLESYKKDRESGFLELFNFIVHSCGCKGVVTLEMLRGLQNSEIIQQLTESFDEGSAEYPLLLNTPVWRRFRQGFCELLAVLVHRTQHAVLYDEYLMGSLIALLTGMSDSQVRAFRHTSTLAAMKLMTGLVRVALSVSLQKDNSQRQYEAEQAKGSSCRALEKLEGLLEQHRELQEKQEELENLMNAIFKGVFIHRYRDLMPEIRAICIEEMGQWIEHYSNSFLTDSYLKYIGWTLHDKQGEVRLKCLLALQGLYRSQERAARMELFTSRFKERMVSMVLDKEPQVAVEAVRLLTLIFQNMDDVLTDLDCASVFPLVYASSHPLAAAAGEFLYNKLLAPTLCARGMAGKQRTRAAFQLLLAFSIESEFHDHASYLVDSLWDCAAALLKDWQLLTGLLLEEPPAEGLGDREENSLIMFLAASVRQATEGQPPVGRISGKKVLSARERKVQVEDRLRLTQHLIPLLPLLLAKFSADAEKVVYLLEVPCYFDLTLYSSGRLEKHLELLLAQLWEVMEKHTDCEVLEATSRTLHMLCSPELAFYSRADFARSRLVDHLADKFQHEATELFQSPCCLENEDVYRVAATLKRIAILHSAHDLTPWNFFDPCIRFLHHTVDTEEIPKQVVISAISCSYFSLYWELYHLYHSSFQEQLLSLKGKVASFCSLCQNYLVDMDPGVQQQAFVVLTDLLIIFGPQLPYGGHRLLRELVYEPDVALQSQLAGFLVDHVFNHDQVEGTGPGSQDEMLQIEQLHQRRKLLAGFCKLIIYGVLELSAASDIFKHYSKSYDNYGDIIKATLNETRQIDRTEWAHTLLLTLQQLLTQLLLEQGPAGINSATFLEIRDLARRFSLLFGLHQLQNRSALVTLHKDGIKFAFQEQVASDSRLDLVHLPFLELLSEFSPRLLSPDKALLLSYLKKISQAHLSSRHGEEHLWGSLLIYQRSLSPQEETAPSPDAPAQQKPGPPAKRRHLNESLGHSDTSFSSTSGSRLQSPLLTSTTLRRKGHSAAQLLGQEDSGSESEFVQSQPPLGPQQRHKAPRRQLQPKNRGSLGPQLGWLTLMEVGEAVVEESETSEEEVAFGKDS